MGMWPTATLTYGYDIDQPDDWDGDEPDEHAGRLLAEAGDFPDGISVHRDYEGCHLRLVAFTLVASGWKDRTTADTLTLPDDTEEQLRRAADVLGIVLGDAKPQWLLTAEFN